MKIFITGATGFIGSHLARTLCNSQDHQVHILVRPESNLWRINDVQDKLSLHTGDLQNLDQLKKILVPLQPDVIVHCAVSGMFSGKSASDEELIHTNLFGTINLIKASQEIPYQCFINTGSSSEYGIRQEPMKETDYCDPDNILGFTKLCATVYGRMIALQTKKPIIGVRVYSPYGPWDDKRRFISLAIAHTLQKKFFKCSRPTIARDYIYIDDLIQLYISCFDKAQQYAGEIFNAGTGEEKTLRQVIEAIETATGKPMEIQWDAFPPAPYDTDHWQADMAKTQNIIGWRPRYNLTQGIQNTVEWFTNNMNRYQ